MGVRSKVFMTVLLVGVVVGVMTYTSSNENLYQGKIFDAPDQSTEGDSSLLPDLAPALKVVEAVEGKDLKVEATIRNIGDGPVTGQEPFKYTIFINDKEVFSNVDSYTTMEAGDSFNFEYPIPRDIYEYPDTGTVKFVLDLDNALTEVEENNNEVEVDYQF